MLKYHEENPSLVQPAQTQARLVSSIVREDVDALPTQGPPHLPWTQ